MAPLALDVSHDASQAWETLPPNLNDVAPEFTLLDSSGTPRTLAELCASRPHVLVFYRGHW